MTSVATPLRHYAAHPVGVQVAPQTENRNKLTTAFRLILGIPHLLLVGGPVALMLTHRTAGGPDTNMSLEWAGAGALGAAAAVCALIGWFAILFTGNYPGGLRRFVLYFMRWRVRAIAYLALFRDEYPPFEDDTYPASFVISEDAAARDKLSVGLRPILVIPHLLAVWALGVAWGVTSIIAWFAILITGRYPQGLYDFGVGVFQWNIRVESYLLLLHDEYPPFSLDISDTRK